MEIRENSGHPFNFSHGTKSCTITVNLPAFAGYVSAILTEILDFSPGPRMPTALRRIGDVEDNCRRRRT
jgi:hypothetical protein